MNVGEVKIKPTMHIVKNMLQYGSISIFNMFTSVNKKGVKITD